MNKKYLVLMRHAKTRYTGEFPDITDTGKSETIDVVHDQIVPFVDACDVKNSEVIFISSPAPRALGTASCVRDWLGFKSAQLRIDERFRPLDWRDPARAKEALGGFAPGYISWEDTPCFRDASIFETVDEVSGRALRAIGTSVLELLKSDYKFVVITSHYEVLSYLVRDRFGIEPTDKNALKNSEPIFITIEQALDAPVVLKCVFRGERYDIAV